MSDYIKFTDNSREVVTLTYDEPLENTNSNMIAFILVLD